MPDEMNFFAGFLVRAPDGGDQFVVERVQTISVPADARKIRRVTDAREPKIKLIKIKIRTEETGHDNHRRTVAFRDTETEINRRDMQQSPIHSDKGFKPDRQSSLAHFLVE